MSYPNWPTGVNTKAYGMESGWSDNREEVEFKSGRRVYWLKNSEARKTHSVMMTFDDKTAISGALTEWQVFQNWFKNTIKSGTVPFYFPDLSNKGTGTRLYYMTETPTAKGQEKKEASFTLEEA